MNDLVATAMSTIFGLPETLERFTVNTNNTNHNNDRKGVNGIPVDILDSPKEYIFYMDVPGLSKSDVQVNITTLFAQSHVIISTCTDWCLIV